MSKIAAFNYKDKTYDIVEKDGRFFCELGEVFLNIEKKAQHTGSVSDKDKHLAWLSKSEFEKVKNYFLDKMHHFWTVNAIPEKWYELSEKAKAVTVELIQARELDCVESNAAKTHFRKVDLSRYKK